MKPHKYYLPTFLLNSKDPLKEFLNKAFIWRNNEKGRKYWEKIFYAATPITLTDINYINAKYGENSLYFGNNSKKIKDILEQEYIFLERDLEIL